MYDQIAPDQAQRHSVEATSDNTGAITFTFPVTAGGLCNTGTVAVASAPVAALFVATVADVPWGTWSGASASPQIQARSHLQLIATGTGLLPLTRYVATFVGVSQDTALAPLLWPGAAFAVPPFSNIEIISVPTLDIVGGGVDVYPNAAGNAYYDCAGWAAVRVAFYNLTGTAAISITVFWQDLDGNVIAQRGFVVGNNNALHVTLPNLGPRMQVNVNDLVGLTGATYRLFVSLTTAPGLAWSTELQGASDGYEAMLDFTASTTLAAGSTGTILAPRDVFSGKVSLWVAAGAFTLVTVRMRWFDPSTLIFQNFRTWSQVNFVGGSLYDEFYVPGVPIVLTATNGDGASHAIAASLVADLYRAA